MISQKVKSLITFGLTLIGAIFGILSTVGRYWEESLYIHGGLWTVCYTFFDTSSCLTREVAGTPALTATQVFMVLGCVGYLAAFVYFSYLHLKTETAVNRILGLVLIITGSCMLIGLIIYSKELQNPNLSYGWSYILGYISVVLSLAAGIVCINRSLGTPSALIA